MSRKLLAWESQYRATDETKDRWDQSYQLGRIHSYAAAAEVALSAAKAVERDAKPTKRKDGAK